MRNRFKPVCGVVDGSDATCSGSSNIFVTFGSTAAGLTTSVELDNSNDCSADGAGVLVNGDNRPRDANN